VLEKQQFSLPDELRQILVGLLLGDLYAQKHKRRNLWFGALNFSWAFGP